MRLSVIIEEETHTHTNEIEIEKLIKKRCTHDKGQDKS
jgi:hypothetical protein